MTTYIRLDDKTNHRSKMITASGKAGYHGIPLAYKSGLIYPGVTNVLA